MDWIKQRYDQFALAVLALALLVCSVMLILNARDFANAFTAATVTAVPRNQLPPLVLAPIEQAKKTLESPPQWNEADSHVKGTPPVRNRGSLFVADHYVLGEDRTPKKPIYEAFYKDSVTGVPIPNTWFLNNNLPLLDPTVATQDPDKDGFTNEEEWRGTHPETPGSNSTDPNDKDSHPPYYSKLFLEEFVRIPFRLVFNAYDGDPKRDKIENISFQINTIDLRQPSEFLKIGDVVTRTKFKLEKFEYKTVLNSKTGAQEDVSELTVRNLENNEPVLLVLGRVTDSPKFLAKFIYKWPSPPLRFPVQKLGNFGLKPATKADYKLIDIKEGKAVIQTPDGQQVDILPEPRPKN